MRTQFTQSRLYYSKALAVIMALNIGFSHSVAAQTRDRSELESLQQDAGYYLNVLGDKIDLFFGDDELKSTAITDKTSSKHNRLYVYFPTRFYEEGRRESDVNFRLKFDLPRTQRRWNLMLTSFEESLLEPDGSSSLEDEAQSEPSLTPKGQETTLSAGYWLHKTEKELAQVQFGIRFYNGFELNPFVRWRQQKAYALSPKINTSDRYNLILDRQYGLWGEVQKRFDIPLEERALFRAQSGALYRLNEHESQLSQVFAWYLPVTDSDLMSYYVQANLTQKNWETAEERIAIGHNWRHQFNHKWLFFEMEPRYEWQDFRFQQGQWSILFKLEAQIYRR